MSFKILWLKVQKIVSKVLNRANAKYLSFLPFVLFIFYYLFRVKDFFFRSDDFQHLYTNYKMGFFEALTFKIQAAANLNLYRPTTNWFFHYNEYLFGYNATVFTLEMLIFTVIIFYFAYKIFNYYLKNVPLSALFATAFIFSPILVEPITWYANICDSLGLIFGLSSLYLYLIRKEKSYYVYLSAILFLLGLVSKETVLCLLPVFVILGLNEKNTSIWDKLKEKIIIMFPGLIYAVIRVGYSAYISGAGLKVGYEGPHLAKYGVYLQNIVALIKRMLFLPTGLSAFGLVMPILFCLGVIVIAVLFLLKRYRIEYLGALLVVGGSLVINMTVPVIFDRYLVFTWFGALWMLVLIVQNLKMCKKYLLPMVMFLMVLFVSSSMIFFYRFEGARKSSIITREYLNGAQKGVMLKSVPYSLKQTLFWNKYSISYQNLIFTELVHVQIGCNIYLNFNCSVDGYPDRVIEEKTYLLR